MLHTQCMKRAAHYKKVNLLRIIKGLGWTGISSWTLMPKSTSGEETLILRNILKTVLTQGFIIVTSYWTATLKTAIQTETECSQSKPCCFLHSKKKKNRFLSGHCFNMKAKLQYFNFSSKCHFSDAFLPRIETAFCMWYKLSLDLEKTTDLCHWILLI